MTQKAQATLIEQRSALRQQLLLQRQVMAKHLELNSEANRYPRSITMRFLTGKSSLGSKLVKNTVTFFGMRFVSAALASWFKGHATKRQR